MYARVCIPQTCAFLHRFMKCPIFELSVINSVHMHKHSTTPFSHCCIPYAHRQNSCGKAKAQNKSVYIHTDVLIHMCPNICRHVHVPKHGCICSMGMYACMNMHLFLGLSMVSPWKRKGGADHQGDAPNGFCSSRASMSAATCNRYSMYKRCEHTLSESRMRVLAGPP